ncbi:hypothetical protein [Aquitalea magnusonii]|uniref:Uncharacterized protein n=1 Tax=Aquitalea magnusonii TaxID=332411 RepID=A0A318J6K4_9NEIS|nr:hypothetical protein [Aquitalea magnusonii]PXX42248.1 hypothetical protein DFR38_12045 [Aquitalea magnusonii]
MKTNAIDLILLVAVAEMAITKLEQENAKLREHTAGYDRLKAENGRLKGRESSLENRIASADDTTRHYWTLIQGHVAEINQLKQQVLELGRQNIALAAQAESAAMLEQALDKANRRIDELEAALQVERLPAASRANVIALIQERAA